MCLSTPCTQIPASPGHPEGPVGAWPSWGEGLDLCPQRPQGKGGGAQEPEDCRTEQDAPQIRAHSHPIYWVYLSLFPSSQLPYLPSLPGRPSVPFLVDVNHCLGLSLLAVPGAPVNMATWPLSAGSPAAGLLQVLLGVVVSPPAWPGLPGPDPRGWLGHSLPFPDLGPVHLHRHSAQAPRTCGAGDEVRRSSSETWPSLTCPVILGKSLFFPGPQFPHL